MAADIPWISEYQALSSAVGVSDMKGRSRIALRGGDRMRFLHSFCTNDIQGLSPGLGCEAFVTSHQGKTVGHVFVFCTAEELLLDAVAGQSAALIAHFDRFVISDDVTFEDLTSVTGELVVAGPQARELLARLCDGELPTRLLQHGELAVGGHKVQCARVDFLRPESFFVSGPASVLEMVRQQVIGAGAVPCGGEAVTAIRLESGTPLFGCDITADNLPQEIGRDAQAISFTKGCYLGQETVARIDAMGHVNRLLVGARFSAAAAAVPLAGTELLSGGKVVGHVTSAAWSPRLAQPLALAIVRRAQATPGTRLNSSSGPAEAIRLPLGAAIS